VNVTAIMLDARNEMSEMLRQTRIAPLFSQLWELDKRFVDSAFRNERERLLEIDVRLTKIPKVSKHKLANGFDPALWRKTVNLHRRIANPNLTIADSLDRTKRNGIGRLPLFLFVGKSKQKLKARRQTNSCKMLMLPTAFRLR
jgi:hypothetical protein